MSLLDSVLGTLGKDPPGGGGLDDLIGMVGNNPRLLEIVGQLLGNDGAAGGLPGLVAKFQQAGLGDVIGSWIGTGENQAISGEQLRNVLGNASLPGLSPDSGAGTTDFADQLSNILPGLVDRLTPSGEAPAAGFGDTSDLIGVLGGLLRR